MEEKSQIINLNKIVLVQDISKVNEVTLYLQIGKSKVQLEEAIVFGSGFMIYWKMEIKV